MADIGRVGFAVGGVAEGRHLGEATELEKLGYSAIWLPGGQIDCPERVLELLDVTRSAVVGTAVLSAAVFEPDRIVELHGAVQRQAPGRTVLGLGGPQQRRSLAAVEAAVGGRDPVADGSTFLSHGGSRQGALRLLVLEDCHETAPLPGPGEGLTSRRVWSREDWFISTT